MIHFLLICACIFAGLWLAYLIFAVLFSVVLIGIGALVSRANTRRYLRR